MRTLNRRRARALASLSVAVGLGSAAALTAVTISPAQSAAPASDCAQPYPVASVADGDPVHGQTVSRGTTPQPYTGEVLGVLEDGIAPDLDMVIVELDSPAIQAAGGIWQGMSGSPVYAADDRLIGAVAYGLAFGPSPIAGVTPFEQMDDYVATASSSGRVGINKAMARRIASSSDVSSADAQQGLSQLKMPLGVSGVSTGRLAKASHTFRSYLPKNTYAAGRASAAASAPEDVVAGGNLAASLSYGDVTQAGIGTATTVCDNVVVGFGHPMLFAGDTSLSLHPANAIYVQPDSLGSPFKVANLGDPAGTINQDHLTGITGVFGAPPPATKISSALTFGTRSRSGSTMASVKDAAAGTTFFESLSNHDRVVDAITKGSESQSWTITGRNAGAPFTLSASDRYASNYDISFDASFDLADIVGLLTQVPDVTLDTVSTTGAVSKDASTYRLGRLEQLQHGEWVKVKRRHPPKVKAGKTLSMRAVLAASNGGTAQVPFAFKIPKKLAGARGFLSVAGGNGFFPEEFFYDEFSGGPPTFTFGQVQSLVEGLVRNDEIQVTLSFFSDQPVDEGSDCVDCRVGKGGVAGAFVKELTIGPAAKVVNGFKFMKVIVKG
jgi:hypothetical protein